MQHDAGGRREGKLQEEIPAIDGAALAGHWKDGSACIGYFTPDRCVSKCYHCWERAVPVDRPETHCENIVLPPSEGVPGGVADDEAKPPF